MRPAQEQDQLGPLALTVFAGSAGYPPGGQMVGASAFSVWLMAGVGNYLIPCHVQERSSPRGRAAAL